MAQLVINELMQSNVDCVTDDLNQFPDSWVELYNPGTAAENLAVYKIGLTDTLEQAWSLPSKSIGAKQHILVYCDKEATSLHTDFRLESGKGGSLYLFKQGVVVDKLENLKKQPAPNIGYGRSADGGSTWGYEVKPTPGLTNYGGVTAKILGDPVFSIPGQVWQGTHVNQLTLSLPADAPADAYIRYTIDGTEPTITSPKYANPIVVGSTSRVVRAKLFCDGWLSPRSVTQSYLVMPRNITLPVMSIAVPPSYLTDNKFGIYVDGTYNKDTKNYQYDWRRPINFELFVDPDSSVINQLCETRICGAASRSCQLKSMALYAHNRFGKKHFKYEFFADQRPGIEKYRSVMIRNAGNDFDYLYMRDAVIQRTMATYTDLDWQAWRPAIIFINGTYKGMLNIRERSNDNNIYSNYDGLEDIDLIENFVGELKTGTIDNWNAFTAFYNEHGHTWAEYEEVMDCREFINLMLMNLFYDNQDFPGNNLAFWRPRAEGGRWRFIAKDTDFGLGLYGHSSSYNNIAWLYDPNYDADRAWANGYESTRLFRRLMEDETFKREFIDRAAIYMGDFMNFEGTWAIWQPMYEQIAFEYPNHRKLVNQWWPNYSSELSSAKTWLQQRTNYFYQHLRSFYNLGALVPMTVNLSVSPNQLDAFDVEFNGVKLSKGTFNGKFFAGRSCELRALPHDNIGVTAWEVQMVTGNGTVTSNTVEGSVVQLQLPASLYKLTINAVVGEVDGIDSVISDDDSENCPVQYYDAQGISHSRMQRGQNIVRMRDGSVRKINF